MGNEFSKADRQPSSLEPCNPPARLCNCVRLHTTTIVCTASGWPDTAAIPLAGVHGSKQATIMLTISGSRRLKTRGCRDSSLGQRGHRGSCWGWFHAAQAPCHHQVFTDSGDTSSWPPPGALLEVKAEREGLRCHTCGFRSRGSITCHVFWWQQTRKRRASA